MSPRSWKILLTVILLLCQHESSVAVDVTISLFGTLLGTKFKKSNNYLPVGEDVSGINCTRYNAPNSEYIVQAISVSKISSTIFKVNGVSKHMSESSCEQMLDETKNQLLRRYSGLKNDVPPIYMEHFYSLKQDRPNCSFPVKLSNSQH